MEPTDTPQKSLKRGPQTATNNSAEADDLTNKKPRPDAAVARQKPLAEKTTDSGTVCLQQNSWVDFLFKSLIFYETGVSL